MFSELTKILSGEKEAPEVPLTFQVDTKSIAKSVAIVLIAAIIFTLFLKLVK